MPLAAPIEVRRILYRELSLLGSTAAKAEAESDVRPCDDADDCLQCVGSFNVLGEVSLQPGPGS